MYLFNNKLEYGDGCRKGGGGSHALSSTTEFKMSLCIRVIQNEFMKITDYET